MKTMSETLNEEHVAKKLKSSNVHTLSETLTEINAFVRQNENGLTPLMFAAVKKQDECVVKILDLWKDLIAGQEKSNEQKLKLFKDYLNQEDVEGSTALLHAVRGHCHSKTIERLVTDGADVNHCSKKWGTALMLAISKDCIGISSVLLEHGASLSADQNKISPLWLACSRGSMPMIQLLLQFKANINETYEKGICLLSMCVLEKAITALTFLLTHSPVYVVVDQADSFGITPLLHAVRTKQHKSIELLLSAQACVNKSDNNGDTPLHEAARRSDLLAVQMLLAAGAKVNLTNNNKDSPLTREMARQCKRDTKIVETLVKAGSDIHHVNADNENIVCVVIHEMNTSILDQVISLGADVNHESDEGTSLYQAIQMSEPSLVDYLMNKGAIVDREFFVAVHYGETDIIRVMMRNGIVPTEMSKNHLMKSDLGQDFMYCPVQGYSPVSFALLRVNVDLVRFFLDNFYLTYYDLYHLVWDIRYIADYFDHYHGKSMRALVREICYQPWTLARLCFLFVSVRLGSGRERARRVQQLPVPLMYKKSLLFQC